MKTIEERRKGVERAIFEKWGSRAEFARKSGISQPRLSRALDPEQATERRLAPIEQRIAELLKGKNGQVGPGSLSDRERYALRNAGVIVRNVNTGKIWFTIKFPEPFVVVNPVEVGGIPDLPDVDDPERNDEPVAERNTN